MDFDVAAGRWGTWNRWIGLGAPPAGFSPGAAVAAVKRDDHQQDVFAVGRDGVVYTSFVDFDVAAGRWGT